MTRKLQSTRRLVEVDLPAYLGGWENVRSRVTELGARAWLFRSRDRPALFLEFIEWKATDEDGPLSDPRLGELVAMLDRFAPAVSESWIEPGE